MKRLVYTLICITTLLSCKDTGKTDITSYTQQSPELSADSAYIFVSEQCAYGPRTMNSTAHDSCAAYIARKFQQYGASVILQDAVGTLYDGTPVNMQNIIASTDIDNPVRIIICSHWDSRPWADQDEDLSQHHTPIDGANDGASGVGLMIEMARQIQMKAPQVGVDFICFDAEDCGTPYWDNTDADESNANTWCLGSQHWAAFHHIEDYRARYGILLDMVGGSNCVFEKEAYSMHYAPNIVDKVWSKAQRLGYTDLFKNELTGAVTDDHVQVNQSGIPCIDIISRDKNSNSFCATWHTKADNVANIDKTTLKAVGQTILEVIYTEQP